MSARSYAVDDPLVGLFLRLAAHPDAAFVFTIFIFALWNLSQYTYALFDGFVYQPATRIYQKYVGVVYAEVNLTSLPRPTSCASGAAKAAFL